MLKSKWRCSFRDEIDAPALASRLTAQHHYRHGLGKRRGLPFTGAYHWVPVADNNNESLPCWPNYYDCSAIQRGDYLTWLQTGRRDSDVELGFVFIYFYGLERRVLIDRADYVPIANEVMRLLVVYGKSNSFRRYGTSLLWTASGRSTPSLMTASRLPGNNSCSVSTHSTLSCESHRQDARVWPKNLNEHCARR